ncbi:hypothetical protein [uncultured Negativibacillus sp.]|uniref:hypothetical protein n=1 Tax=uncultured Negativibacillus sp. TaxID=1980696 RepID=UPI0025DD479F|nr:hypothetical protein [uncultured Negativibacillus sp.]
MKAAQGKFYQSLQFVYLRHPNILYNGGRKTIERDRGRPHMMGGGSCTGKKKMQQFVDGLEKKGGEQA